MALQSEAAEKRRRRGSVRYQELQAIRGQANQRDRGLATRAAAANQYVLDMANKQADQGRQAEKVTLGDLLKQDNEFIKAMQADFEPEPKPKPKPKPLSPEESAIKAYQEHMDSVVQEARKKKATKADLRLETSWIDRWLTVPMLRLTIWLWR